MRGPESEERRGEATDGEGNIGGAKFRMRKTRGPAALGIVGDELMLRGGPHAYEDCLALPHARKMGFTGRGEKGIKEIRSEEGAFGQGSRNAKKHSLECARR